MIDHQWIEKRIDGIERGMAELKSAVASLESSVRAEKGITEKHDALLRRLSELVATVNITLSSLERGVNGLPVKVAEQARDIERLSARLESINGDVKETAAAEIAGRYATSKAIVAALGSIAGAIIMWILRR